MILSERIWHMNTIIPVYFYYRPLLQSPYHVISWPYTSTQPLEVSFKALYSREGCVTKCGAKFLNSSDCLPLERSPTKPVLTFVYTHYSLWRHILTLLISPHFTEKKKKNYAQFPKLTTIRCKRQGFFP